MNTNQYVLTCFHACLRQRKDLWRIDCANVNWSTTRNPTPPQQILKAESNIDVESSASENVEVWPHTEVTQKKWWWIHAQFLSKRGAALPFVLPLPLSSFSLVLSYCFPNLENECILHSICSFFPSFFSGCINSFCIRGQHNIFRSSYRLPSESRSLNPMDVPVRLGWTLQPAMVNSLGDPSRSLLVGSSWLLKTYRTNIDLSRDL